jgi:alpha-D-xyloside xylohydrolase
MVCKKGVKLMKFSDGNWLIREGFEIFSPVQFHDLAVEEGAITVYATPSPVENRSGMLDTMLFTIRFSAPLKDVIRVQMFHHKGVRDRGPHFALHMTNEKAQVENREDEVIFTNGRLSVKIQKRFPWSVAFYQDGKRISGSGFRSMAYILEHKQTAYMREQLDLGVGETIYGLGERFTPFVKNGQTVDIWNQDGGTGTEQAYKNIPFYVSNKGYGVFVNHPELVSFEVGSEKVSKVQFSVKGESLDYILIGGPTVKQVLENYTTLTGKPGLPPAWSFGLWLTTSFTTDYDEQTVRHFVDGMRERDIPLRVFHFDCFWMKEFQWCDFQWDERIFPEPEQMLKRLKEKGLKICVWINPYIAQQSPLFEEGMEKGYLLKRPNGDVWQWDKWQPGMGIVDFTNPDARKWYTDHLRRLVDMGVDCFKTDFGERIPTDVVYDDGSDPEKMHNYYTYLYNQAVYEVLEEKLGRGEAVLFARSATAGCQKFPVHWGGDCSADYESMAESLRGGLSLGMSGFGFWSHDIGGFESNSSADVYKRWLAFGLLSSHSRLHGSRYYRVPWLYDEEAVDVARFFTKLKCRLMPYLYGAAVETARTGVPMMRAMVVEYPDDPACLYLDRQYMLGDALLVAPVMSEEGEVSYYLPEGQWIHLLNGDIKEGGRWFHGQYDYFSLPLYVRANSIIAFGQRDDRPDYDFPDGVKLHLFALQDGKRAETTVYDISGREALNVVAERVGDVIDVHVHFIGEQKNRWSVVLRGVDIVREVEGGRAKTGKEGIAVLPDHGSNVLRIHL